MSLDYADIEKRLYERFLASYIAKDAHYAARFASIVPPGDINVAVDREEYRNRAAKFARLSAETLRDLIDGGYFCRKEGNSLSEYL